jgi:hypothetical protein
MSISFTIPRTIPREVIPEYLSNAYVGMNVTFTVRADVPEEERLSLMRGLMPFGSIMPAASIIANNTPQFEVIEGVMNHSSNDNVEPIRLRKPTSRKANRLFRKKEYCGASDCSVCLETKSLYKYYFNCEHSICKDCNVNLRKSELEFCCPECRSV